MEKNEYSSPVMESAGGGTPQTMMMSIISVLTKGSSNYVCSH